MGGCRCTFRDCTNSSGNSPGMHFFHYPLKDEKRLEKWIKYSNYSKLLEFPFSKARNKVVCETHFRDECFMNYKKDRLVHYAIPTLTRLLNNYCLDYEESDDPSPKIILPSNKNHLVPPKNQKKNDFDSNLPEEIMFEINELIDTSSNNMESDKPTFLQIEETSVSLPPHKKTKLSLPPKILNSCLRLYTNKKEKRNRNFSNDSNEINDAQNTSIDNDLIANSVHRTTESYIEDTEEVANNYEVINDSENEKNENELLQISRENTKLISEYTYSKGKKLSYGKSQNESESNFNFEEIKKLYEEKLLERENQIKELKTELEQQKQENSSKVLLQNLEAQVETISTSKQLTSNSNTITLTKAQLFNSIKKYLTPSMSTLVRMEMFGGPDREWKTDEKQLCVELLNLGDNVFKYVRDEWRFRLPPIKSVETWLNESKNEEQDEDL